MPENTGPAVAAEVSLPEQQTPEPPPLTRTTRLVDLGFVALVALTPLFLGAYAYRHFPPNPHASQAEYDFHMLYAFAHEVIALCALAYVFRGRGKRIATLGFKTRWADLPVAIGLFFGAYIGGVLSFWVIRRYIWLLSGTTLQSGDVPGLVGPSISVIGFLFIMLNPVFEEVIVRSFVTLELKKLTGSIWLASATSVLIQSSYHLYQPLGNVVMLGAMFTVLAVYFARTNRIIPVIIVHFFFDLAAYLHSVK